MIKYEFKKSETLESALGQLYKILTLLRSPEGCPWDRAETQESSCVNLKNEIFELVDEINLNNKTGMGEELGDIVINTLMLLKISSDDKDINIVECVDSASKKLLFRHPHVFGALEASSPEEALEIWNKQKTKEGKKCSEDFFKRIPKSKSVFERTIEVNSRVKKAGFNWNDSQEIFDKHDEELKEVKHALKFESKENLKMELGDLIFTCISLADNLNCDPEECLHLAISKFENRFNKVYNIAKKENIELKQKNSKALNEIWTKVKEEE